MTNLKEGDPAPDFSSTDQDGNPISLADLKGQSFILFFYPKDNTETCTIEACNLRDNYADLKARGFRVLGVSNDSERKHRNFIAKYKLPYDLIADTDKEMVNAYGVYGLKKFMGREHMGIYRTTFVIDEEGIIQKVIQKVRSKDHSRQILEELGLIETD